MSLTSAHLLHIIALIPHITARIIVSVALLFQTIRVVSVVAARLNDITGLVSHIVRILWPISRFMCLTSGDLWQPKNDLSLVIEMMTAPDRDTNGPTIASR
jgi:hypothetical protein